MHPPCLQRKQGAIVPLGLYGFRNRNISFAPFQMILTTRAHEFCSEDLTRPDGVDFENILPFSAFSSVGTFASGRRVWCYEIRTGTLSY